MKTNEQIREEFKNFCNTDNFSAPPYETDIIADWFLAQRTSDLGGLVKTLEGKKGNSAKPLTHEKGYNQALQDTIDIINKLIEK